MSARKRWDYEHLGASFRPLYESGLSTHAIAAQLNVPQAIVPRALRAVGCKVRTQSDALKIIGYGRRVTDEQIAAALQAECGIAARAARRLGVSAPAIFFRLQKSDRLRNVQASAKADRGGSNAKETAW